MKKLFIVLITSGAIIACGGNDNKSETKTPATESKTEAAADDLSSNPVYQKGLELVGKSDCMTCHKIEEKNIGPAWRDVANKYSGQADAVDYLAKKIIDGGSGVWGEVPMAPHTSFSQEDAKALAQYVLLLKK